jgi:predicted chitinase
MMISAAFMALIMSGANAADSTQMAMKSPMQVQKALGTLNRVVDHTGRLISAKNYAQLPHENGEFKEGSEALEKSIASDDGGFKSRIEPLLQKAEANSQNIAEAAMAHDDTKLASNHEALRDSVKAILAAFPSNVQPPAPSVTQEKAEEKSR